MSDFRARYLSYGEIESQLHAWAAASPAVARLESAGRSAEGRELWVLTVGPEPSRARPAAWVDGNMHAGELCGSSVALAIAEDMLALHADPRKTLHGLPKHVCDRLREVPFIVMPRVAPDGAEAVLRDGRYVRSNPRDGRVEAELAPRWVSRDIDGDGRALVMRKRDDAGDFVESREVPGVMLPREVEDEGPFYRLYPEGVVQPWDGRTVPDPHFLCDNETDLNRNFPWSWRPEPDQVGAGRFPMSEPEARAIVEYVSARPQIFAWLNLHTFGGVYIRPLGHLPDSKMAAFDLAVFRQIAAWGETHGGYPTVSGFEEFTYEPDKPLHGDLTDFAYHQRGALAYVCELWDLFRELGIARKKPFVRHYTELTRDELVSFARWDAARNAGRVFQPWRACAHPQLGDVEVGGLDARVGLFNPPYDRIAEVCARQSAAFLRVAAMAPAVRLRVHSTTKVGDGACRVDFAVTNEGYLPTYVLASARALPWNTGLVADVTAEGGAALASPHDARHALGHLEGWGRGLHPDGSGIFYQRSRGASSSERVFGVTVVGRGAVRVRLGAPRVGWTELRAEL